MGIFARRDDRRPVEALDAPSAIERVHAGAILVDVRTGIEWGRGHAPEARHIPLERVARRAVDLPHDAPIITICQSGHRSALAAQALAKRGFTVSSVTGGMPAWKAAGGAVEN
ncbi:hypothetical protein BH09ACT6_BH09ACT6_00970 [soil metagenome]